MKSNKRKVYYEGRIIEVSNDVYTVLIKSDRKIKYIEEELKEDKFIINDEGVIIAIIPSREDSIERIEESGSIQFEDKTARVEEILEKNFQNLQLHRALLKLKPDERDLIEALFFENLTQREYASKKGVAQVTIYKKKKRILCKLKKFLLF